MTADDHDSELIPPPLLAEVEAVAAAENRAAHEVVREAVECYVRARRPLSRQKLTPGEAGARMLERRKGNVLPEGVTIRDLQIHGRS